MFFLQTVSQLQITLQLSIHTYKMAFREGIETKREDGINES